MDNENKTPDWSTVGFTNSLMFYYVLTSNKELCKHLIEVLLNIELDHIVFTNGEQTINIDAVSKGIRLDIFTKNDLTQFDVELQAINHHNLPKRARYYQGAMDLSE